MASGSVNKVFLIGNLGSNPEVKYILEGILIAKFTIATSTFSKNKDNGEKVVRTEWHKVVAYNKNAELVKGYLKKGSKVYVEGFIKSNIWQGNDGVKRLSVDIIVQNLCLLDKKESFFKESLSKKQLLELEAVDNNIDEDDVNRLPF